MKIISDSVTAVGVSLDKKKRYTNTWVYIQFIYIYRERDMGCTLNCLFEISGL
jgi:hypothetical protein